MQFIFFALLLGVSSAVAQQNAAPVYNQPQYVAPAGAQAPVYDAQYIPTAGSQAPVYDQQYNAQGNNYGAPMNVIPASGYDVVEQCSCAMASNCATVSYARIEQCHNDCAQHLEFFAELDSKSPPAASLAANCFTEPTNKQMADMHSCFRDAAPNYCLKDNGLYHQVFLNKAQIHTGRPEMRLRDNPDYKVPSAPKTTLRTAQNSYTHIRNFQECTSACVLSHTHDCIFGSDTVNCALAIPNDDSVQREVNKCMAKKIDGYAKQACNCLYNDQRIRKLVGACPLLTSPTLMKTIEKDEE